MPSWDQVLSEIKSAGSTHDLVRRKYLKELHEYTGRNAIIYYSGWLEKGHLARQGVAGFELNDSDKNGFMAAIHELDRDLGLDLIVHTPGGETAATESLVDYLRAMFGINMRAIVPHLAMSAGTMVALACREIVMGKHSSLGPIDPQIYGMPAHGVVEEFNRAVKEVGEDPSKVPIWQPIIANYRPTLIGECEKAIEWSSEMVEAWLRSGMYADDPDVDQKVQQVLEELGDHALTKSHARHISATRADEIGLNVAFLEDDQDLQERVLTVHHACTVSLSEGSAVKIVENHNGVAHINSVELRQ